VSESAFHLTPIDIRKQEFRRSLRGYEPAEVDEFRARVAEEVERLLRERAVLEERLASLTVQVRTFHERERAMNDALVSAQQLREDTRLAAQREAEAVVRAADAEGRKLVDEARGAEADVRRKLAEAERQFQAYVGGFRALLERQAAELRALDGSGGG
jgi:cell division initiation protein